MTTRQLFSTTAIACGVALATFAHAQTPDLDATDTLKRLQTENVATAKQKLERVYHFGSQGNGDSFSNHTSHSNRLIPVYTFGSKIDLGAVTGTNSIYRDAPRLEALYGFAPENTVNPKAEYADQSDLYKVQLAAVAKGVKHLFIVWFDGMDWQATQAAAIVKSEKVYTSGKGSGLIFQDYNARGTAQFGYYVTAPTHEPLDAKDLDVNRQSASIPLDRPHGGYDVMIAGPNPWTLGPLASKAPGYLKGHSGHAADKAGVLGVGRAIHAYTDSSTSAGEFATGKKAYNNGVNVLDNGSFPTTFFRQIQRDGWKIGTVTSVPFDHASPAAMYAHNVYRDDYQDLARDMLGLTSITQEDHKETTHPGLDVVIGTGFGQVASEKGLLAQGKNGVPGNLYITDKDKAAIDVKNGGKYVVVETAFGVKGGKVLNAAAAVAASKSQRLFGFYGSKGFGHLPYQTADGRFDPSPDLNGKSESYTPTEVAEQPTLADMTTAAITVLAAKPENKFALFIEAGDVDWALHANNLDNAVGAVFSGDAAVRAVIDWVEKNSNWDDSALIVTADHGHYLVLNRPEALLGVK